MTRSPELPDPAEPAAPSAGPGSGGPGSAGGVIATKLFIPRSRHPVVRRPRLDRILDRALNVPLTLVVAPAGWGKSTLVADWVGRAGLPVGWVWLERAEDDPTRFWRHVLHAMSAAVPAAGRAALSILETAGADIDRDVLPALVNSLAAATTPPCLLVLDDFHAVHSAEVHRQLSRLLEHRPAALHLLLLTRSDPPLTTGRLRLRGELVEIRSGDLHFTVSEAGELMRGRLGADLDDGDLHRLVERTEGWAAGLHLVALRLAGLSPGDRNGAPAFIARFTGADRHVVDYLGEEVLAGLEPSTLGFLLRTAVLTRLCAPLCAAVTGRSDSARVLDEIERANLFLTPLDDAHHWLRYHQLFRDILLHELARTAADEIPALHRRAARWYADSGEFHEAIRHAVSAGDRPATADLVATAWRPAFNAGQLRTVESWLSGLSEEAVTSDPRLTTARLWLALDSGRLDTVEVELRRIEATGSVSGQARLMRALHTFKTGDLTTAADRLTGIEPTDDAFDQTVRSLLIGVTALWRGEFDRAAGALDLAIGLADRDRNRLAGIYATGCRALVAVLAGRPEAAAGPLDHAQALIEQAGDRHFVAAFPALARAHLAMSEGDRTTAASAAGDAVRLADRGAGRIEQAAAAVTAARAVRHAEPENTSLAEDLVARARELLRRCPDPGPVVLAWSAAEPPAAARDCDGRPPLTEREIDILALLPGPMTQRELAAALFVSPNTLKTHLRAIYRKLGAQSRADAVLRARRAGLLSTRSVSRSPGGT